MAVLAFGSGAAIDCLSACGLSRLGVALVGRLVAGLRVFRLLLFGFFGEIFFADVLAVADAEHHDHVIGFFLGEDVARDVPPIEIALGVVAQQAGIIFVLTVDGDFRLIGKCVFQPVSQPVGHAVADDDDGGRGRDALFGLRGLGAREWLGARLLVLRLGAAVAAGIAEQVAEKAAAA